MSAVLTIAVISAAALAGVYFLSRSWLVRAIAALAVVGAVGGYVALGRPGMSDEPLQERLDSLVETAALHPETLSVDQVMALLQKRAQDKPNDPVPHKFMGDMLAATGRMNEALMAYRSALRRDPDFQPALKAAADTMFKMTADVDANTTALYRRAFEMDPSDLRIGYLAALGDWRAGKHDQAREELNTLESAVEDGDPRGQMFQALRQMLAPDSLPGGEQGAAPDAATRAPN